MITTIELLEKYLRSDADTVLELQHILVVDSFVSGNEIYLTLDGRDNYYTIPLLGYITFVFNSCK